MASELTDGHLMFRKWKRELGKNTSEIGKMLGVSQAQISRWDTTSARPDGPIRTLLRRIAGIPEEAWLTKAEAKRVARLAKKAEEAGAPAPTFPAGREPLAGGT